MMVLVAIDSFKGTMTSMEAGEAVARGIAASIPGAVIEVVPVSDGGEGMVEAWRAATGGSLIEVACRGPLAGAGPVTARILVSGRTAVIEMAASSGLCLVPPGLCDPLLASTHGVGDQILAALGSGARDVVVGVGGSATCDAGAGMAEALGATFLDRAGRSVHPRGGNLESIRTVDLSGMDQRVRSASVTVACDVTNPLLGPLGAARVFAPQKGASPAAVEVLERGLARIADLAHGATGLDVRDLPGSGAAGGLAAGLVAFCGARLEPGFDAVATAIRLEPRIAAADLVVTGEGSLDEQTLMGKLPAGVAGLAARHGKPVIAFCGRARSLHALVPDPFREVHDLVTFAGSIEAAMTGGPGLLERLALAVAAGWGRTG